MRKICLFIMIFCASTIFGVLLTGAPGPAMAQGQQKMFSSPDEAAQMLLEACRNDDEKKLIEFFGEKNRDLMVTQDRAMDTYIRKKLHRFASEKLVKQEKGKDTIIFVVGKLEWPFPFPLVKEGAKWRFDSVAGREEIINRRVGRDELNAVALCRHYVQAQRRYAEKAREGDDIIQYAQKFGSSPGKRDGLYWSADPSKKDDISPLGPALAESQEYASSRKQGEPFWGYHYRILTKQGREAPGGAYSYIINGHMVAGYALIAYPSDYGTSGMTTFIVNQSGKVYEKDLGKDTIKAAQQITEYNPDKTWKLVKEEGILATD
ncbi:MAG: DUF2950 domain-containing protein [Candidatus Eremiobacteraeota bacterium]|nr:DUF2950 domain-containing protein [Candidatus Eremiobacteraeota bacterium]